MIYGYHVIMPMYGFWLPNDPRGSFSDFVRRWELVKFGQPIITDERRGVDQLTEEEIARREAARKALMYPPVSIDEAQAAAIARGFERQVNTSDYTIWACSIMPEHTHFVIARHRYDAEQIANLLKGASTRQIMEEGLHPLASFAKPGERPPRMWAARAWKGFLDSEEAIENAIRYVEANPTREGKPKQEWPFVKPFRGLPQGGWFSFDG